MNMSNFNQKGTPEDYLRHQFSVFIVNFEHIQTIDLVFNQ